ncbi:MAG: hypothetical protein ACOCY2_01050 [Guyparkeria sp.]|uniref:hypothetical protein n=1 Tax=Guyparkeria sp. TaxID=2035736 RepID=UPI00397D8894
MRPTHLVLASFVLFLTPALGADEPWKQPGWEPITDEERQPASPDEVAESAVEVREYQGTRFLTGGLGTAERAWLQEHGADYPVALQFSKGQRGAFVSAVDVRVRTPDDKTRFEATTDGPMLFIDLPEGRYTASASYKGEDREFSLDVPANGQVSRSINFPE